jgi:hypothetical protein
MNDDGGKEGKIHHGGNPVLTAAALGAAVVPDVAGNLDRLSERGWRERSAYPLSHLTCLGESSSEGRGVELTEDGGVRPKRRH